MWVLLAARKRTANSERNVFSLEMSLKVGDSGQVQLGSDGLWVCFSVFLRALSFFSLKTGSLLYIGCLEKENRTPASVRFLKLPSSN